MKYVLAFLSICSIGLTNAQNINWSSINENQNHLLYLNLGYDYGVTTQIGYGCILNRSNPIILSADCSVPMGNDPIDDFKIQIGAQTPVIGFKNIQFSIKLNGVYRRHQTQLLATNSLGAEMALLFGIYKTNWHLSVELGYNNAVATQLNHSDQMKAIYPQIKNGWFWATAGNFFYGIQGSKRIGKKFGLTFRIGATNARLNDKNALIPIYFQLGAQYTL